MYGDSMYHHHTPWVFLTCLPPSIKPTWVCLKMFGKARNANGSWSIFQLKIAIRWLTYGWSRCRNGTNPQYLSGILLFSIFSLELPQPCKNSCYLPISYDIYIIYISPCNIPRLIVTSLFGWTKNWIDFIDLHWKSKVPSECSHPILGNNREMGIYLAINGL